MMKSSKPTKRHFDGYSTKGVPRSKNDRGQTPLHFAAEKGDIEVAKSLMVDGHADMNLMDNDHRTPLQLAIDKKLVEVLKCVE